MRKLDVLMLKSFVGPFILTTGVSNFILLIQYLLKYFDDFVGKNLGIMVFGELLFYFSLNMLQIALPLGVLVASLMTFGNLGENFELTAIKGSGISLLRTMRPIFYFVVVLSIGAYFFNNYTIPAANLKAYSLLYDIKHTKPALDIKSGTFYNGIPDYSIKAAGKLPDGKTLLDVMIYDHTGGRGNRTVILADSGLMYTILDDRYLKLELYNGNYYSEIEEKDKKVDRLYRTEYHKMDMVFSLASFDLKRRKEELFQNNRQMKNISELTADIDSFQNTINQAKSSLILNSNRYFEFHIKDKKGILDKSEIDLDSIRVKKQSLIEASFFPSFFFEKKNQEDSTNLKKQKKIELEQRITELGIAKQEALKEKEFLLDTAGWEYLNKLVREKKGRKENYTITTALNQARNIKVNAQSTQQRIYNATKDRNLYTIEKYKKYAQALACILMFMIGAPLGAIIKKGGLGMPTIIAILFFIIYYVFSSIGEKSAKEGAMNPYLAVWLSDIILLPFGLFFLRQARVDARLFEVDFYNVWVEKLKTRFAKKENKL
ncbi:MAG: LptF/LptG family permease [Cyclobacteriaceae bacterium]